MAKLRVEITSGEIRKAGIDFSQLKEVLLGMEPITEEIWKLLVDRGIDPRITFLKEFSTVDGFSEDLIITQYTDDRETESLSEAARLKLILAEFEQLQSSYVLYGGNERRKALQTFRDFHLGDINKALELESQQPMELEKALDLGLIATQPFGNDPYLTDWLKQCEAGKDNKFPTSKAESAPELPKPTATRRILFSDDE